MNLLVQIVNNKQVSICRIKNNITCFQSTYY